MLAAIQQQLQQLAEAQAKAVVVGSTERLRTSAAQAPAAAEQPQAPSQALVPPAAYEPASADVSGSGPPAAAGSPAHAPAAAAAAAVGPVRIPTLVQMRDSVSVASPTSQQPPIATPASPSTASEISYSDIFDVLSSLSLPAPPPARSKPAAASRLQTIPDDAPSVSHSSVVSEEQLPEEFSQQGVYVTDDAAIASSAELSRPPVRSVSEDSTSRRASWRTSSTPVDRSRRGSDAIADLVPDSPGDASDGGAAAGSLSPSSVADDSHAVSGAIERSGSAVPSASAGSVASITRDSLPLFTSTAPYTSILEEVIEDGDLLPSSPRQPPPSAGGESADIVEEDEGLPVAAPPVVRRQPMRRQPVHVPTVAAPAAPQLTPELLQLLDGGSGSRSSLGGDSLNKLVEVGCSKTAVVCTRISQSYHCVAMIIVQITFIYHLM